MPNGFAPKLAQLQTTDTALLKIRARLKEIDGALGADSRIRAAQETTQAAEVSHRAAQAAAQWLDSEQRSVLAKRAATDEQLYSGRVNNPKALTELQQEVEALDRQSAKVSEALLAAQGTSDETASTMTAARQALSQAEDSFAHTQSDLVAEKKRISADFRSHVQMRKDLTAEIAPDVLARYEDLRVKKKGTAVARLRDGACMVCGVELTVRVAQQVRAGELVTCESCGRLLVG